MTTIRVAQRRRFTAIDRALVNDEHLSFRARGVLIWLLDKPDDWRCTSEAIARATTEGRDAVRSALKELETAGYLRRERYQDPKTGQWWTTATIYETPGQPEDGNPVVGDPDVGQPVVGESGALTKTEDQKTETEQHVGVASDEFVLWWRAYLKTDRPGSKGDALKAWGKLRKMDKGLALVAIYRHLGYLADFPGRFTMPNGSTWLSKMRWLDEMPQEPPRQQPNGHKGIAHIRQRLQEATGGA